MLTVNALRALGADVEDGLNGNILFEQLCFFHTALLRIIISVKKMLFYSIVVRNYYIASHGGVVFMSHRLHGWHEYLTS